jgi:hypothetical protein
MFLAIQSTHRMLGRYHPVIGHLFVANFEGTAAKRDRVATSW